MTIARRLLVSGRVQGVSYRDWAVGAAGDIGVAGWVRNLADGRVEIHAEGEPDAVAAMVARARRGSPGARVTGVAVSDAAPEGSDRFRRRGDG